MPSWIFTARLKNPSTIASADILHTTPQRRPPYQIVNPTPMLTLNAWRPKKLVEQGDQRILAAVHEFHLLETDGAELGHSRHNQAQSLLDQ
jgi:hypothetical protein